MKTTGVVAVVALIAGAGSALYVAPVRQPGITRTDLQRHDLSIPGREVVPGQHLRVRALDQVLGGAGAEEVEELARRAGHEGCLPDGQPLGRATRSQDGQPA